MSVDQYKIKECRYCDAPIGEAFLELGVQPLANNLVQPNSTEEEFKCDLSLVLCDNCKHTQLTHIVPADLMFKHYLYVSSTTQTFRDHFAAYAADLRGKSKLNDGGFAVDIGSNDGLLVKCYRNEGFNAVGVDPAENLAKAANEAGILTINKYFDESCVKTIIQDFGKADVISCNNVFAHIGDIQSVVRNVTGLLSDVGILTIEFPYYVLMHDNLVFDMIYHEHVSFMNVEPLQFLMNKFGLEIFDIQEVDSHGGSLRVYVSWKDGAYSISDKVQSYIINEQEKGYNTKEKAEEFATKVLGIKDKLWGFVNQAKAEGKTVAGYGAPAKASTIINFCEFGPDDIDFIIDDNPLKQNLLSPGTHIPIMSSKVLEEMTPDYLIIFAWNFATEIIKNNGHLKDRGVKFIVPLPEPKLV
jgi:SAM-dependent methyltransferase